mmetsp:Transcript_5740/g.35700  ORF Transcript_5740/g.35700 Transcript_5740/m.35700 type:complete len:93 (-) Transcript_5740:3089-3367(-)
MLLVMRGKVLLINHFIHLPIYHGSNSHCGPKAINLACHVRGHILMYATTWLCRDTKVEAFDSWHFPFCQKFIDESLGLLSLAGRSFHKTPRD